MRIIRKWMEMALLMSLGVMVVVYVWTAFDIRNRIPFAMLSQIPVFVFLAACKMTRPTLDKEGPDD